MIRAARIRLPRNRRSGDPLKRGARPASAISGSAAPQPGPRATSPRWGGGQPSITAPRLRIQSREAVPLGDWGVRRREAPRGSPRVRHRIERGGWAPCCPGPTRARPNTPPTPARLLRGRERRRRLARRLRRRPRGQPEAPLPLRPRRDPPPQGRAEGRGPRRDRRGGGGRGALGRLGGGPRLPPPAVRSLDRGRVVHPDDPASGRGRGGHALAT